MSAFTNRAKDRFLSKIPTASLEAPNDRLAAKCKFNFAYFCVQPAGQDFSDWTDVQRKKLLEKLVQYSREPLSYWEGQSVGKSGSVLAIYGAFPSNSDFEHPLHVPHEVLWGRFRLEQSLRLVGFVVPRKLHGATHPGTHDRFDSNTFYVVFLDRDHRFYKVESN